MSETAQEIWTKKTRIDGGLYWTHDRGPTTKYTRAVEPDVGEALEALDMLHNLAISLLTNAGAQTMSGDTARVSVDIDSIVATIRQPLRSKEGHLCIAKTPSPIHKDTSVSQTMDKPIPGLKEAIEFVDDDQTLAEYGPNDEKYVRVLIKAAKAHFERTRGE